MVFSRKKNIQLLYGPNIKKAWDQVQRGKRRFFFLTIQSFFRKTKKFLQSIVLSFSLDLGSSLICLYSVKYAITDSFKKTYFLLLANGCLYSGKCTITFEIYFSCFQQKPAYKFLLAMVHIHCI